MPLLQALVRLGSSAKTSDVYPVVEQIMKAKFDKHPEEYEISAGEPIWKNETQFAGNRLKENGQFATSEQGIWKISQSGRERVRIFKETGRDPDRDLVKSDPIESEMKKLEEEPEETLRRLRGSQPRKSGDILGLRDGKIGELDNSPEDEIPLKEKNKIADALDVGVDNLINDQSMTPEDKQQPRDATKNSLLFIKEVAKYFMDFLETDFHKRRNPRRKIKLRNEDNLLVGLNLSKYPAFNNRVWKCVIHSFDKKVSSKIKKGVYKTNIPKELLSLIKIQINKLTNEQIDWIIRNIGEELEKEAVLHSEEFDKALTYSLETSSKIIKDGLVLPYIRSIEKPLENVNLGDENVIYLMEEELTDVLIRALESKISELLKLLIAREKVDISKHLQSVFNIEDAKNNILEFFDTFKVTDLFAEVFEMDRNRNVLDKQEFYLYFCDITFNKVKYPIFYIPFSVEREHDIFNIEFDFQVYINKRALEYIVEEYNREKDKRGNLKTISERIIYLAQHKNDFRDVIDNVINEIVNFFELDSDVDISNPTPQVSKSRLVRISNSCYMSLFDKSDEALVNDYEDILRTLTAEPDSVLAEAFGKLIDDFIHKDPKSFDSTVEDEWDDMGISDKLVFSSPIPLNSEQRRILSAIKKDGCKYVTVQGPPGTGKSHTITAIVCDAVLTNQSVLVLSDKKEALDVVEDKITETMNKVRFDRKFQNPILRLGRTGSTYAQILSTIAIENIRTHYRAVKKEYENLQQDIEKSINTLKEDLEAEVLAYGEIDIKEICEVFVLESYYEATDYPVDVEEVLKKPESTTEIREFRRIFLNLKDALGERQSKNNFSNRVLRLFSFSLDDFDDLSNFLEFLDLLTALSNIAEMLKDTYGKKIGVIQYFREFFDEDLEKLRELLKEYENLRSWIFGYFLKGRQVNKLNKKFEERLPCSEFEKPHQNLSKLKKVLEIYDFTIKLKEQLFSRALPKYDYLSVWHRCLKDEKVVRSLREMTVLSKDIEYLVKHLRKHPKTLKKINVDSSSIKTLCENRLTRMTNSDFDKLIGYINLKRKIAKDFSNLPVLSYGNQKENIEDLATTQMTYLLDEKVIDFYENSRATAKVLRNIIRSKQQFPKNEFMKLKDAFPCILAGIRDYAQYIPLEPEIFDLVIIDEASQVSIAQAFPALLRAKKVVIFGDKKQFSNVKAAHARSDINKECLHKLEHVFRENISKEITKLVKLEKFNIKTSILEFLEFITNYDIQLMKYFRGYKELISYSNKYFYQDSLQVVKIRGKVIDEVLKFKVVDHDGKTELSPNTNTPEVKFIISELKKLKDNGSKLSVGIITPHTNQQKLIAEMISRLPERDYFFDVLKLKIMTFDTCQGEEKDIVFYSMVATENSDRLWGVFIKDLDSVDLEGDGQIKAQRLNVGFSRAKECMHFVLSKDLDAYTGSIGEALRHYSNILEGAKKERGVLDVDQKSKMEPEVLHWFYQTEFWKENRDKIEFKPQFEIGKYLRQLDKTYNHPNYRVDFLLVYKDKANKEHKVIIEYDGFEHFKNIDDVNKFNYQYYYSDEDVYREKVLESYGYKFIRINRFNLGENPIATLDRRIGELIGKKKLNNSELLVNIHETIEGLRSGKTKECLKCRQIRPLTDFRDDSLLTGYGRFCSHCKDIAGVRGEKATISKFQAIRQEGRRKRKREEKEFEIIKNTPVFLFLVDEIPQHFVELKSVPRNDYKKWTFSNIAEYVEEDIRTVHDLIVQGRTPIVKRVGGRGQHLWLARKRDFDTWLKKYKDSHEKKTRSKQMNLW